MDKFLLGKETVNTDSISDSPYNIDLSNWVTWTNPILSNGKTFYTSLVYPSNLQVGLDTNVTFKWKKINEAEKYYIELSADPSFANIFISDSITTDTSETVIGLLKNQKYYWHVKVKSASDLGPWSNTSNFVTTLSLPAIPQIVSAISNKMGYITLKWKKVESADRYSYQVAYDQGFTNIFKSGSTSDTVNDISWFSEGKKYYWRLQATNLAGSGSWSDAVDFTLLYTPTNLALQIGAPNEITLTWVDNSTIKDGYIIERKQSPQTSFSVIDTLKGGGAEYIDKSIEPGQTYTYRIKAYKDSLESEYSNEASLLLDVKGEKVGIPTEYSISQNYPNPFNPTTKIEFALPKTGLTKIIIYDFLGREVQTLINKELNAGYHEINIDAKNLPSGVYFYRIQSGDFVQTKKMILMK